MVMCFYGALLTPAAASPQQTDKAYAHGRVLLKMRTLAGKAIAGVDELARLHKRYGVASATPLLNSVVRSNNASKPVSGGRSTSTAADLSLWQVVEFSSSVDPAMASAAYAKLDAVDSSQPNYLRRFCAIPDDPLYSQQSNLRAMGPIDLLPGDAEGIIVAIIDSGVDYLHPDVADQIWVNAVELAGVAGKDDDANGYVDDIIGWDFADAPGHAGSGDFLQRDDDPMDESGHGSHVAGIIGAGVDNGTGISGMAAGVQLMVLRSGFQVGGTGFLEDDDIAAAIIYAVDNGAHIINLSLGDPSFSPLLRDVIRYATEAGVLVVAAAGNEAEEGIFYPARLEQTIAVAAADDHGRMATFSNWGPAVDLAAPGVGIPSLALGGAYAERSGTSMSTAHVSGAAALLLARWPHLNPEQLRSSLMHDALDISTRGWDPNSGAGLVQVSAAPSVSPLGVQVHVDTQSRLQSGVQSDSVGVEVTLMGAGAVSFTLSWGVGRTPESWTPFARQEVDIRPGSTLTLQEVWPVGDLPDSSYVIRAEVFSAAERHSDHSEIELRRGVTVVQSLRSSRALEGDHWDYIVEWETTVPAAGVVVVQGEDGLRFVIPVPQLTREHRVVLPADLPVGVYEVLVRSSAAATTGEASLVVRIPERSASRWYFELGATLAAGYLMPLATDLDGDGMNELAAMVFGQGTYAPASFFELTEFGNNGSPLLPIHTTSRLFIPWGVHDLDSDGKLELMAVDAQRVRLLEAGDGLQRFPDTVVWEQGDVWGGEAGSDSDADGRREMFLRSSLGALFRVYEHTGSDNEFAQVAVIANPTDGLNGLGERQVIGDFDADGKGDFLVGDEDGDLFVFESIGDNVFDPVWVRPSDGEADGRLVGGGVDLDGDGRVEFAVGRLLTDRFDPGRTLWSVTIYQHQGGDDDYEPEFELRVLGGKGQANGISMGDVDGDGLVELCVALVPDLYLLRATGPDEYEPVWHTSIQDSHRPLVADLDADGVVEIAYNSVAGPIEIVHLADARASKPEAPVGLVAVGSGPDQVTLNWQPVVGATQYRLFRRSVDGQEELLAQVRETVFVDLNVDEGTEYVYSVAAVALDDTDGRRSAPQSAIPLALPVLLRVERLGLRHLVVEFDGPMGASAEEAFRYQIDPDLGSPSSAVGDRGGRRVVLAFDDAFPEAGSYLLNATELRAPSGTRLADGRLSFAFDLEAAATATRLVYAEIERPTRLVLRFNAELVRGPFEGGVIIDEGRIVVEGVTSLSATEVAVTIASDTPLQPWGRRYEVAVFGWRDVSGAAVNGRTFVQSSPADLAATVVFPNPFDPSQGNLSFGGLPTGTRVSVFSIAGARLQVLEERDGDGGVQWDGRNETGKLVGSGLYYYRLVHAGVARSGSFAVIRR